jgi:ribosome recycling factor
MVPLSQVANVSLLDARTISVQPWEKGMGAKIEKAIRESDLGLNPASMGDLIRVPMPPMSEERRKEMTKLVRNEGENAKIAVRNLRRDANEAVKKLVKDKLASEDDQKRAEADIQKVTDRHIAEIDRWWRPKSRKSWRSEPRHATFTAFFTWLSVPPVVSHTTSPSSWMATAAGPRAAFCRAWRATSKGLMSLRRCVHACACSAAWRADRVCVFVRKLESSATRSRPDGVAGHGAGARGAAAQGRRAPAFVGERAGLSRQGARGLAQAEAATADNTRLVLNVCFNYGGRWDIAQAAARLAARGEPSPKPAWTAPWPWPMCPTPTW